MFDRTDREDNTTGRWVQMSESISQTADQINAATAAARIASAAAQNKAGAATGKSATGTGPAKSAKSTPKSSKSTPKSNGSTPKSNGSKSSKTGPSNRDMSRVAAQYAVKSAVDAFFALKTHVVSKVKMVTFPDGTVAPYAVAFESLRQTCAYTPRGVWDKRLGKRDVGRPNGRDA